MDVIKEDWSELEEGISEEFKENSSKSSVPR